MTSEALTAERCAIVLDSTSDLPDCRERHANMRMVPLTVRFGDEELLDYEEIIAAALLRAARGRSAAAAHRRAAARALLGLLPRAARARRLRARALAAPLRGALGHGRARRAWPRRSSTAASPSSTPARSRSALRWRRSASRGSSTAGPCALGRPGGDRPRGFHRRSRLVFAFETLEFLQRNGRIGRGQALVGGLLGRAAAAHAGRGRGRAAGARARPRAPAGGARAPRLRGHARRTSGCASASRTPRPRTSRTTSPRRVRNARPEAVIELVAPLGAVVGTNTGPGGAGLVWARESG